MPWLTRAGRDRFARLSPPLPARPRPQSSPGSLRASTVWSRTAGSSATRGEVRFWQQSNALIESEPLYVTAARRAAERGRSCRTAKLFWWFNQGADSRGASRRSPTTRPTATRRSASPAPPTASPSGSNASTASSRFTRSGARPPACHASQWIGQACGERRAERATRADPRLHAPPRLRPSAIRPVRLRHAPARRRARRRVRPDPRRRESDGGAACGSSASTATATSRAPSI